MDTYYTIEEKYLKAIQKVDYGRISKGLSLLKEIVENEPLYARAHYQLGKIYYYELKDYQAAGYHLKLCLDIEPEFPDAYFDYLNLVVFLNMEKLVQQVTQKALKVAGVCKAEIYSLLGLFYENNRLWANALAAYSQALLEATEKEFSDNTAGDIDRVKAKMQNSVTYQYNLSG